MRFCKKASLNLSINAIVVLILAITMLGLGLAFMRNIFGSATKEFEEVGGTVKKQMIDQMKESTKIVDLTRPKVELKTGESTQVFIGFKNDGSNKRRFEIDAITFTSLSGINNPANCDPDDSTKVYLEYKRTGTEVLSGDTAVLPLNIKTSSDVIADTCFYELNIIYEDFDSTAASVGTDTATLELTVDVTN